MSVFTIPKTMNAVVCHGKGDYRYEEVPVPEIGREEVLLKVLSSGICAGDIKCFAGAAMFWGDADRPGYCETPVIPGHEFVGRVVDLGEGAAEKYGLAIGDHAVSEQIIPCGECRFCLNGQYWMCAPHDIYGFHRSTQGSWAEYMKLPAKAINHKLPDDMDPKLGVFVEPLACSIHAVNRGKIGLNDVVVISGCGPLGLGMVAAARLKNPAKLIALDLIAARLDLAMACGADLVLNPTKTDVVRAVREMTDGYGCDVYIEATGAGKSVAQGLHMIRKLGTFVEFSVFQQPVTVDWTIIGDSKELDILGAHCSPHTYPVAIRMLRHGLLPMDKILSHSLPLAQFRKGMELAMDSLVSLKVSLEP